MDRPSSRLVEEIYDAVEASRPDHVQRLMDSNRLCWLIPHFEDRPFVSILVERALNADDPAILSLAIERGWVLSLRDLGVALSCGAGRVVDRYREAFREMVSLETLGEVFVDMDPFMVGSGEAVLGFFEPFLAREAQARRLVFVRLFRLWAAHFLRGAAPADATDSVRAWVQTAARLDLVFLELF